LTENSTPGAVQSAPDAGLLRRYERLDWIQTRSQIPEHILSTSMLARWFEASLDRIQNPEGPGPEAALNRLVLGAAIVDQVLHDRPVMAHAAMRAGATWREVAAALHVTVKEARALVREHAVTVRATDRRYEKEGRCPEGYADTQYAAVLALIELGDDERRTEVSSRV
jgi:plasmid maintenance system antidote protein VapI